MTEQNTNQTSDGQNPSNQEGAAGSQTQTPAPAVNTQTPPASSQSFLGQAKTDLPAGDNQNPDGTVPPEPTNTNDNTTPAIEYTDFTIPNGIELDKELIDTFKPIAKDLKLTQEQAQKLVDLQTQSIKKSQEQYKLQFEQMKEDLKTEAIKMLGPNYEKELAFGALAIDKLLPPKEASELREVLNSSGFGFHPLLIKMCVNAGKLLSEDSFVNGQKGSSRKTDAEVLFG